MKKLNIKIRKLLLSDKFFIILSVFALLFSFLRIKIGWTTSYNLTDTTFTGVLVSYKIKGDKLSFVFKGREKLQGTYYFQKDEEKEKLLEKLKLGSRITVSGELSRPNKNTIPNTFNYQKFLYNNKIFYVCKASLIELDNSHISLQYKVKNSIIKRINSFESIYDYMETFIIGDKSYLDEEIFTNYRRNGVTHLFAISGMHIGLFSALILKLLKKIHLEETKRYIIVIIFIWFYAFLTSFSPSVLRAGLLFTILALNKIFYTEIKGINCLILTGVILIIINPYILLNIGFIYSFTTTFGLMLASDTLKKHKILGTSVVAFFAALPITINNFYEFNLFSIFLNIIFVPYVSVIIYPLCLLTFIFSFLEPVTYFLLNIMEFFSSFVAKINFFTIISPKMNVIFLIIYYIIFLKIINKKISICVIGLLILIFINIKLPLLNSKFEVTFLDIGQGDSIILRFPHNQGVLLIDTGGKISYKKEKWRESGTYYLTDGTITYLKSLGIKKIDYLILSHGDFDHMGEGINLVENFKVEKVIFNCGPYNGLEKELIKVLGKKKISYYSCIKELDIANDKLYFLQTKEYGNENDFSNVIYTELNGYKFMFMGDASITTEKEILNKYDLSNIDVLKVGHHGSKTSSSEEFINKINPKYSIISVGKNNRYGHPNKEVLNNLEGSKIYRTDQDGSIMFRIKNDKLQIETYTP